MSKSVHSVSFTAVDANGKKYKIYSDAPVTNIRKLDGSSEQSKGMGSLSTEDDEPVTPLGNGRFKILFTDTIVTRVQD